MNSQLLSQTIQYKPLDLENTNKLFKSYQNGDMEAKQKLILHNIGLVIYIQKKYDIYIQDDDIFQVGIIGLIKAVRAFDLEKGYKFATFATTCIENEIRYHLRTQNKYNCEVSLNGDRQSFNSNDDNDLYSYEDIIVSSEPTPEETYVESIEKDILCKIIDTLKEPNKQIVEFFYGFNGIRYNQEQIGQIMGLSQSYVSRIINNSTNNIKTKYLRLT